LIHKQFFKSHFILGQSACFVRKYIIDSGEFFWDTKVSGDTTLYKFIAAHVVALEYFGDVEVDFGGDGDDLGEQQDLPDENDGRVFVEPRDDDHAERKQHHHGYGHLHQVVDFHVDAPEFEASFGLVHLHFGVGPSLNHQGFNVT